MTKFDHAKLALTKEEQKNAIAFVYELQNIKDEFGHDAPDAVKDILRALEDTASTVKSYKKQAKEKKAYREERNRQYMDKQKRQREEIQVALLNIARTELQVGDDVIIHIGRGDKTTNGRVTRVTKARAYVSTVLDDGRVSPTERMTVPRFVASKSKYSVRKLEDESVNYYEIGRSWSFYTDSVSRKVNYGKNTTHTNDYHMEVAQRIVYGR